MSPRKSSTSSGSRRRRSRYLGLEVAGEPLPSLSPRAWELLLAERAAGSDGAGSFGFRLIRSEGRRAVVEVDQFSMPLARERWNSPSGAVARPALRSRKTWGTLVGAKAWLRGRPDG